MIGSLTGPTSLERFVDLAVPELRRRGLFHTDYAKGTLRTLGGPPLRAQAGERRIVAMIDFHTHWIPSGLPNLAARSGNSRWPVFDQPTGRLMISGKAVRTLPVHAGPAGSIVDSLDRAEAAWAREGTASALLSLQ